MKILVIRFSSIGDIVLTSPITRCVRNKYPNSEIQYLTKSKFTSLVEYSNDINEVKTLDEKDENIMGVVRTLSTGSNSLKILNHVAKCVQAIQNTKTDELKLKLNPKE